MSLPTELTDLLDAMDIPELQAVVDYCEENMESIRRDEDED